MSINLFAKIGDLVKAERRLTELQKLGGGSLSTPRPRAMHRTHNDAAPVRGQTGYDAGVDDRRPFNPDSGENPIIRDHHQALDDIKSGKLLWNDPKVHTLVALERKRIFEND